MNKIIVVENGNMNTQRYIQLLENDFIPCIREKIGTAIFMQGGARAHTSNVSLRFLRQNSQDRSTVLDLNLCDFFLWPYLKSKAYQNNPLDMAALIN